MANKTWPIAVDPTCQLKWTWSTIYLTNSASASCHRTRQYPFDLDTFDQFHNLPGKLQDRELMLNGEWPGNGCEYCKKIEDAGGFSDRMWNNQNLQNALPSELSSDPQAVNVVPKMIEVYFDNTCDLKCVYCGPYYSSAWQNENKKHGYWAHDDFQLSDRYEVSPNRRQYVEKFWSWWDKHFDQVNHFQFLGGEPFVQQEFDEFVDFLSARANPNLWINLTSNLNCSLDRLKRKIGQFKALKDAGKIGTLQIVGSIDCWGPEQEHTRFPLSLKRWEENFEYLISQDWIVLNINSAINTLSIKAMPELLKKLNKWREKRAIFQNFMTVQGGHPLNPEFMGPGVYDADFDIIIDLMKETASMNPWYESFVDYMTGIKKQVTTASVNPAKQEQLYHLLNELDSRRGTNWRTIYPWLADHFQNVIACK